MKRLLAVFVFMLVAAVTVYAADNVDEICKKEGGCFLITQHAYDFPLSEIAKLTNTIAKLKKEQCA